MAVLAKVVLTGRGHGRRPVDLEGTLRVGGAPFDVMMDDLSIGGFRATTDANLCAGDRVVIGSPTIQLREAEVVWARNGEVGFKFANPLRAFEVDSAGPSDTVVSFPVAASAAPPSEIAEPAFERRPRSLSLPLRVGIILASSIALWTIIVVLYRML